MNSFQLQQLNNFFKGIIFGFILIISFLFAKQTNASVLSPGIINTCGELAAPGTYTLGNSVSTTTEAICFTITSNSVVLDGAGLYTAGGNIVGNGTTGVGFSFTLQNIIATGTVSSNGLNGIPGINGGSGSGGGNITISSSTIESIEAKGGSGINATEGISGNSGNGGNLIVTNSIITTIDVSGTAGGKINIDGWGLNGYGGNGGNGGNITMSSSSVSSYIYSKGGDGGDGGGLFGLYGGNGGTGGNITISSSTIESIDARGGDTSNNIAGFSGNGGNISISGIDLNLSSTTITVTRGTGGSIFSVHGTTTLNYTTLNHANLYLSALSNLTLNGPGNLPGNLGAWVGGILETIPGTPITSSAQCNLGLAGTYILSNNITGDCNITHNDVVLNGAGYTITGNIIGDGISHGAGFNFTLQNIVVTGTTSSNGSIGYYAFGETIYPGIIGGAGGNITISSSTLATTTANGGEAFLAGAGAGGNIIISSSTINYVSSNGGASQLNSSISGNGGSILIATSTIGILISNGGNGRSLGGNGGTISITNSFEYTASSTITANGGNATVCGSGGNGGSITLIDSTFTGSISTNVGSDQTAIGDGLCTAPPSNTGSSSSGIQIISGIYTTQIQNNENPTSLLSDIVSPTPYVSPAFGGTVSILVDSLNSLKLSDIPNVNLGLEGNFDNIKTVEFNPIEKIALGTNAIVNSPTGKTVQTVGLIAGLTAAISLYASALFATPLLASELLLIPIRLWGLVLMAFGLKKRIPPWGTVYDSYTKRPIDPAFVRVMDESGKIVAEAMTDIDGRYGFLLPDGKYRISAEKTNYEFPSKKLAGKLDDELYRDLYFGEEVEVKSGEVIDKNIPLDRLHVDWNEEEKFNQNLTTFHKKNEKLYRRISNYVYKIGLIISLIFLAFNPSTYNIIMVLTYLMISAFSFFGVKGKKFGYIRDRNTGQPFRYAIFRVTALDHQTVLRSGVSDAYGRYYCIVPKGEYYLDIKKKNSDGTYTKIYESDILNSTSGIINTNFAI